MKEKIDKKEKDKIRKSKRSHSQRLHINIGRSYSYDIL